ncbi:MAG: Ppx/GppA family phosphatase [Alphaproteobacteria bacterium]|nr:Ppx/GppA family phosphatase [Alphaproteobacteria bacterium]
MDEAETPATQAGAGAGRARRSRPAFAALDLGTNNCRLLIAEPAGAGFRIVDGYSQIVRLGEGLAATGALGDAAMTRALGALAVCARKVRAAQVARARAVATQACRSAANGAAFLERVACETGLQLDVIDPEEEARLAVAGCASLIDPAARIALVIDIGGGSTELSVVEPRGAGSPPRILDWVSTPYGVVTLAERWGARLDEPAVYDALVAEIAAAFAITPCARHADALVAGGHLIGTSGTVTSLAGVHLGLPRYVRAKVDGLWMHMDDVHAAAVHLREAGPEGRAANACIGPERADLVGPGAAILEAVARVWPARKIRVADRGLREGLLLGMMQDAGVLRRTGRERRE